MLQPLIEGRAVRLHPVVILMAVTAAFLLFGIGGAVVAVPVIAVIYRVARYLRHPGPASSQPNSPARRTSRPLILDLVHHRV